MEKILDVKNLQVSFNTYAGEVRAVRDVSFHIDRGETLCFVGESGCGKTVTAKAIMRLLPKGQAEIKEGSEIVFDGKDVLKMSNKELQAYRGGDVSMIFQDPMTSLNPTMRIGAQVEEIFVGDKSVTKAQARERALEIFQQLGITDPERRLRQYPHELSGGMKQRVMIAIALIAKPDLIIADEPTTSLDVTIEAQILQLLKDMNQKTNVSVIIITHDLGVIAKLCDRVLVMYGGQIVERGTTDDIFYRTRHPYTSGLMHSIARLEMDKSAQLTPIEGSPPDLFSPPVGCPFAARCEYAMEICSECQPPLTQISEQHKTCCWLEHPDAPKVDLTYKGGKHDAG